MKIGIFGGSFNPVHNMHINISLKLINDGYLDMVIYVPVGNMYNKKDLISFKDRLNMLKLIVLEHNNLLVSDIGNDNNYQYTYQVLDYFKNIYKNDDIYFICGSDNLSEFDTWKRYKYILENYKLLVIKRNGDNIDYILDKYNNISNIIVSNIKEVNLSSTEIRNNIDKASQYLDDKVYSYIKKNNLYRK